MKRRTTLYITKESHKFSAAHYTIFGHGKRERLHGHNYQVSARIVAVVGDNGFSADYNVYKNRLQALCDHLDEYMLLPASSPYQAVYPEGEMVRVEFGAERMQFLASDTLVLPVTNVTVEELSHYLLQRLLDENDDPQLEEIELFVASGPSQRAGSLWRRT